MIPWGVGLVAVVLLVVDVRGRGTIAPMLTRVAHIADAGGNAGSVEVESNRQPWAGGKKRARKVAEAALVDLFPGARIVGVTYAGRSPSLRQTTPHRYLVTFTRPDVT